MLLNMAQCTAAHKTRNYPVQTVKGTEAEEPCSKVIVKHSINVSSSPLRHQYPIIFPGLSSVLPPITTTNIFSHLKPCSISVPLPWYLLPTLLPILQIKSQTHLLSKSGPNEPNPSASLSSLLTLRTLPPDMVTLSMLLYLSEPRFPHLWTRHRWSPLWSPKSTTFIQPCIKITEK